MYGLLKKFVCRNTRFFKCYLSILTLKLGDNPMIWDALKLKISINQSRCRVLGYCIFLVCPLSSGSGEEAWLELSLNN